MLFFQLLTLAVALVYAEALGRYHRPGIGYNRRYGPDMYNSPNLISGKPEPEVKLEPATPVGDEFGLFHGGQGEDRPGYAKFGGKVLVNFSEFYITDYNFYPTNN